jgi:uncharacterized protein YdaU (DUF1376 family)
MAQFPMLPLYTDAFIGDTTHLSTIEVGAYFLMLLAAWRSHDCALPNDDKSLRRITRMTGHSWAQSRATLLAFWTSGEDGRLHQKRLLQERKKAKLLSQIQRERALKRWHGKPLTENDSADAVDEPAQSPREADPRESPPSPSPSFFSIEEDGENPPRTHTREARKGNGHDWRRELKAKHKGTLASGDDLDEPPSSEDSSQQPSRPR